MASNQETQKNLYYEDISIGQEVCTDSHTVTEKDILMFAEVTRDCHPLHTDPEYCKKTKYGKPIAHGLFGLSLIEGLKSETGIYEQPSIASLGWDEVRFLKPIFANDTVFAKYIFLKKRKSRKPGRGIVTEKVQLLNQKNDIVIEGSHTTLLISRSDEQ